jgi:hypothetical protein
VVKSRAGQCLPIRCAEAFRMNCSWCLKSLVFSKSPAGGVKHERFTYNPFKRNFIMRNRPLNTR